MASNDPTREVTGLARATTANFFGSVFAAGLGFIGTILIGRGLPLSQAGMLFDAIAVFTILSTLILFGFDWGLIRLMPAVQSRSMNRNLLSAALLPVIAASCVVAGLVVWKATYLAQMLIDHAVTKSLASDLRFLVLALPAAGVMGLTLAATRRWSSKEFVAVQNIAVPGARVVLLSIAMASGVASTLAPLAWAIPVVAGGVVSSVLILRRMRSLPEERVSSGDRETKDLRRSLWRFSMARSFAGTLAILGLYLQTVLVGILATPGDVAAYAVVIRYAVISVFVLTAVGYAIAPALSRLWARNERVLAQVLYREATWWVVCLSWPVLCLTALYASPLMRIFGPEYTRGASALTIVSLATLASTAGGPSGVGILILGGSVSNLVQEVTTLCLNIALDLLLIPRFGINGAAIAWAANLGATVLIDGLILYRKSNITPFTRSYWTAGCCSIICFGSVGLGSRITLGMSWPSLAVATLLGATCYSGLLIMLHRHRVVDLSTLRLLIGRDSSRLP